MSHILHAWDAFYAIITTKLCHWWKGTQTWYKFFTIHSDNRWTPKCSLPVPYYGIKACVCVKSPQAHTTEDALGARYARHLAFKRAKNWSNFSCPPPPPHEEGSEVQGCSWIPSSPGLSGWSAVTHNLHHQQQYHQRCHLPSPKLLTENGESRVSQSHDYGIVVPLSGKKSAKFFFDGFP